MFPDLNAGTLKNLLAYSSEAIVFSDLQGTVLFANLAAEKLYGWATGELLGENVDVFNAHASHSTEEIVEDIKNKGRWQGTLMQRRKDGSTFHSELTVALILDENKEPIGFGSHSRDVTDILQAQQELRESEEKYRNFFNNSRDGIIIHHQGRVLEFNQRVCEILGWTAEQMQELHLKDIIHPADMGNVYDCLRSGREGSYRHRALHRDGNTLYFQVHASVMQYCGRQVYAIMVHDITELQEQAARIQGTLQDKEVLLGEVYHRTKNNMQVISGLLSLRAAYFQDEAILYAFQEIIDKIQSMSLVHQKLYESRNLSSIQLNEYIEELAHLTHASYENQDRTIQLQFDLDRVSVMIDTAMACGLILSELLSNAFKHAFQGRRKGAIQIQMRSLGDHRMRLDFQDDGVGVADTDAMRQDSGLGIRTIIGIVEHQLMGQVQFESKEGLHCSLEFRDGIYASRV